MLRSPWKIAALLAVLPMMVQTSLEASGGGSPSAPSAAPTVERTPAQEAEDSYRQGLRNRDKAWKLEEKAKAASAGERAKLDAKAQKQFVKAIGAFEAAIRKNPAMFQAHSSLGYALRRTGDFENSLAAYNQALSMAPNYAEAIEYRAEALLGLNRVDEAKEAYVQLFKMDRKKADELMEAMQQWVEARTEDPSGLDTAVVEEFSAWCKQREELADQTATLGSDRARNWSSRR